MSRELAKMNLISVVQQLPKDDIELIQGYVEMIENENKELKEEIDKLNYIIDKQDRDIATISKSNRKVKEIIDKNVICAKCSCGANVYTKYNDNTYECHGCNRLYKPASKV